MSKPPVDRFWNPETIEELAQRQGVKPVEDLTTLIGSGKDLWESEEVFAGFVEGVRRRLSESRSTPVEHAAPGAA